MTRVLIIISGGLLLGRLLMPAAFAAEPDPAASPDPAEFKFGFDVGEELVYKIYWGFIPVGKSRIVTQWIEEDGRRLLAIRYRTRSNSFVAKIYPVDDRIESVIDPHTFLPVRFTKNLREGRHRYHETTTFDFENLKAHWKSFIKKREKIYDIKKDTRDLLCFIYYMRSLDFKEGETRFVEVMADEKLYDLEVKAQEIETVKTKTFGEVKALKLEPKAKFQGLFVRKGRMITWGSLDDRFVAVKIVAKIPLASVKVLLTEVHGPGDDKWTRATAAMLKEKGRDVEEEHVEAALKELDAPAD